MDYAAAKKRHPKLKVRNVRRLIRAIREADSLDLARAKAERKPLKIGRRRAVCRDAEIESATDIGRSKVPLVFFMGKWMSPAPVDARLAVTCISGEPACGTAACIAGFAGALTPESKRSLVDEAIWSITGDNWIFVLAEFLGIDFHTATDMISTGGCLGDAGVYDWNVKPRHAVRLLENFLETGKVDWFKAMGVNRHSAWSHSITKAEMEARRMDEGALDAARAA